MKPLKTKQKSRLRLLLLCYAAALLVWLCLCGARLGRDTLRLNSGTLPRTELAFDDFDEVVGMFDGEALDLAGTIVSTDPDPRLVLDPGAPFAVTRVVFKGQPLNKGSGEMVLYYTTQPKDADLPGADFSETRKVWAKQNEVGEWVFDLHGRTVYRLRLDPDNTGGVVWRFGGVVLNERISPALYFVPGVQQGALLLLLPLFAWGLIGEVLVFLKPLFARRRFEKRWNELA